MISSMIKIFIKFMKKYDIRGPVLLFDTLSDPKWRIDMTLDKG